MTVFRDPFGLHFEDLGGLEAAQKHFGRGLKCALLEKSVSEGCLKTTPKPRTTLAWSRNCSNIHLDAKKYGITLKNSETVKIHNYLQYFELKPVFVGRSEDRC